MGLSSRGPVARRERHRQPSRPLVPLPFPEQRRQDHRGKLGAPQGQGHGRVGQAGGGVEGRQQARTGRYGGKRGRAGKRMGVEIIE